MRRSLAISFVAGLLLLSACSSGDDEGSAGATEAQRPAQETPSTSLLATTTTLPDPGSCEVDVTGDVTMRFTGDGGVEAVGLEYWLSATEKETMSSVLGTTAPFFFLLSCDGDDGSSVTIAAGLGASAATIPFGPATYTVNPSDTQLSGGGSLTDPLSMLVNLAGTDTSWGLSQPGTVTITRFDDERIAGTFTFPVTDVLAGETDVPSKGSATITGTFDLGNPSA